MWVETLVPEFIDPVFTKTSPKRSFSVIQNERFGLVFAKTGSIILGIGIKLVLCAEAGISKNYWATNSGSPEVKPRFCPWFILFKY